MEHLLKQLEGVNLDGFVGPTDPLQEGDIVLGELDITQRKVWGLLTKVASDLTTAKREHREVRRALEGQGARLRNEADFIEKVEPLAQQRAALHELFWGSVKYQHCDAVAKGGGLALRENWQVVRFKIKSAEDSGEMPSGLGLLAALVGAGLAPRGEQFPGE